MRFDQSRHQPGYNWHLLGIAPCAGQALFVAAMLGLIAFAAGCSGFVAGQTSQTTPPPPPTTYSISGTISPTAGGSSATVTLSGAATALTTANSSGNYTFAGLANGTYAVTPSHTGYTFSPTSQTAKINGADVTGINFTGTVQQAHSVALSWNASTSAVIGYNVYRSTLSGTGYTRMNSALLAVLAYTDTTVQSGTTYYYVTTAVDSTGIESAYSNEAKAIIP
jgi:ABC-type oligopeptide transport system substrate-binding subunit